MDDLNCALWEDSLRFPHSLWNKLKFNLAGEERLDVFASHALSISKQFSVHIDKQIDETAKGVYV